MPSLLLASLLLPAAAWLARRCVVAYASSAAAAAALATDSALLAWARALAPELLDQHPAQAERHVARWLGAKSEYLKA